jgi:hypothetical protein
MEGQVMYFRIVTDEYAGYEVQQGMEVKSYRLFRKPTTKIVYVESSSTFSTVKEAEDYIARKAFKSKVIKEIEV